MGTSQSLTGQTVNAVTGQPLTRVLVRYGRQTQLTDYAGHFQFVLESGVSLVAATKPGYSTSEDPAEGGGIPINTSVIGVQANIRMYPEAIITGTVLAPNGDPLPGILVQPRRLTYDDSGHHWVSGMVVGHTNSHGRYRLALTAGDYCLLTLYSQSVPDRTQAVLPVRFPEENSSSGLGVIHLRSGNTEQVDLHPLVRSMGSVSVRFDPPSSQRNVRFTARLADGISFPVRQTTGQDDGDAKLIIPLGNYTLEARSDVRSLLVSTDPGRREGLEGFQLAEAHVTVGEQEAGSVVLHFAAVSPIPIEMIVEAAATSDNTTPPTIERLGLSLENAKGGLGELREVTERLTNRGDQSPTFSPAPGSYRLRAQAGIWYIRSASYGTSDLLRQELTVTQGASSLPIRVVVSHGTASLAGTLRMDGQGVPGWIYIVAATPSATPVLTVHAGLDGSYTSANMPPGSYRAIAFEHRQSINFEDAETLAVLTNRMQAVTLSGGDKGALNLVIASLPESH